MAANLQVMVPLIGYMDEPYARRFLVEQCVPPVNSLDATRIIRKSQAAALRTEPDILEAKILEFPTEVEATLSGVRRDERLTAVVKNRSWSLCQVEMDKLISVQKYLNSTYSDSISKSLDLDNLDVRIRFCLTDDFLPRHSDILEVRNSHLFAIEAPGTDLRVVESKKSLNPISRNATVSFTIGWGQPIVRVARLQGRYILTNGYHRAFALRSRGIEFLPCVLIEAKEFADLEVSGPLAFSAESVLGKHPPIFQSFFNEDIAPKMKVRSVSTMVVVKPDVRLIESEVIAPPHEKRIQGPATRELEYLDVRTVREDWNVYTLGDGTLLKLKAVISRAKRAEQQGTNAEADVSQIISVCNPAQGRKGPRSRIVPSAEELRGSIVQHNIDFKTIREPINEYAAEGGHRILLHLRLLSVSTTSKYDENGDPMYVLDIRPDLMKA